MKQKYCSSRNFAFIAFFSTNMFLGKEKIININRLPAQLFQHKCFANRHFIDVIPSMLNKLICTSLENSIRANIF